VVHAAAPHEAIWITNLLLTALSSWHLAIIAARNVDPIKNAVVSASCTMRSDTDSHNVFARRTVRLRGHGPHTDASIRDLGKTALQSVVTHYLRRPINVTTNSHLMIRGTDHGEC